jgi:hypothetical protein
MTEQDKPQMNEREAIVAWLRQCREAKLAHHKEVCFREDDEILDAIITAADTFGFAADQIERGWHIEGTSHDRTQ